MRVGSGHTNCPIIKPVGGGTVRLRIPGTTTASMSSILLAPKGLKLGRALQPGSNMRSVMAKNTIWRVVNPRSSLRQRVLRPSHRS